MLVALMTVLALTGCDGDEGPEPNPPSPTAVAPDPSPSGPASSEGPSPQDPTVSEEPTSADDPTSAGDLTDATGEPTEAAAVDDGELPGERFELFPYDGAALAVVGVQADDTLNVRSGPGVGFDVLVALAPLAEGVVATGHNRQLDGGAIWSEITVEGTIGWANTAFLTHLGPTEDITSRLFPTPEDRPRAETMLELGQLVGERVTSDEPPSIITVDDGPEVGDLGEITVDVIGLADDSTGGVRLQVFAQPDESAEGFTVHTVEQTAHCSRGVTDDGLCI